MEVVDESLRTGGYVAYFLLSTTLLITLYHYWWSSQRHIKMVKNITGLPSLPVFGNALEVLRAPKAADLMSIVMSYVKLNGIPKVFKGFIGPKLIVALMDPRDVELILGGYSHLLKSEEYRLFEPWLGDGLLINSGEKWRTHRKMIAPTFHNSILKTFIPIFNKKSKAVIHKFEKHLGKSIDVHDYMSEVTVDILLETAMGVRAGDNEESNAGWEYAKAVMDMCNILHQRHYKIWLRPDIIFNLTHWSKLQQKLLNIIHSLTLKVLKRKRSEFLERKTEGAASIYEAAVKDSETYGNSKIKNNADEDMGLSFGSKLRDDLDENDENDVGEKKRLAFLDFMIEASYMDGIKLSDEDIKNEVDTIMFEGHDTTAAGSSFVLCMLGVHQDVQEKVVQELHSIFHGSDRPITYNDTLEMKYLGRVILETLRLYPPVPMIARKLDHDVKLVSENHTIPKGCTVIISPLFTHRLPEYYPNPKKFNPDNFLPEECQKRHYFSFIPFSAGPRSCVGRKYAMLKLKVLLANMIRQYKIYSDVAEKDFRLQGDIILKRADGFKLRLEKRL